MATTVGNRAIAYLAAPHAAEAVAGSAWITATFDCRTAEQIVVPLYVAQATASANFPINIYRSADGGANFATVARPAMSISRLTNSWARSAVVLDGGKYAIAMCSSGPNTATLGIDTCEIVTGYVGVA